jgi:conjugative transfer pilus assembly protein TraH
MRYFLIFCLYLQAMPVFAWNISDVFSGMSTNVTPPGSYQDQAAGYYSGGGYSMRTKRGSFQPLSLTPPSLKMGCGGIDMYFGSFSMIQSDQLVQMAKNIGANAKSYGFQLAMKTYAPQMENLLSKLRDMAMSLNEFAVEDCQAMQSMFSAALPRDSAMYETVCKDLQHQSGSKDYFKSREHCSDHQRARQSALEFQQSTNNEVLTDNFNLFILAAKKAKIPDDMLEPMMAIAGSVVVKDGIRTFFDSLISDQDTFIAHLNGGTASNYKCDTLSSCLNVSLLSNQVISQEASYQGRAAKKLGSIKSKMVLNTAFNELDKDFLSSLGGSFPIYNYISLEVVTGSAILDKSSSLVANYMILHYLGKVINEVKQVINQLQAKQINDSHFKDYLARLDRVQDLIEQKSTQLSDLAYRTEKRSIYIENHYMARIK